MLEFQGNQTSRHEAVGQAICQGEHRSVGAGQGGSPDANPPERTRKGGAWGLVKGEVPTEKAGKRHLQVIETFAQGRGCS